MCAREREGEREREREMSMQLSPVNTFLCIIKMKSFNEIQKKNLPKLLYIRDQWIRIYSLSAVVEQPPHPLKVKGSSSATATESGRETLSKISFELC